MIELNSNYIIMRIYSAVKEVFMSKKVLILSGSPRKGGNSDILCDEFLRGVQDAEHQAEKIRVAEIKGGSLLRLLLLYHPRRCLRT